MAQKAWCAVRGKRYYHRPKNEALQRQAVRTAAIASSQLKSIVGVPDNAPPLQNVNQRCKLDETNSHDIWRRLDNMEGLLIQFLYRSSLRQSFQPMAEQVVFADVASSKLGFFGITQAKNSFAKSFHSMCHQWA